MLMIWLVTYSYYYVINWGGGREGRGDKQEIKILLSITTLCLMCIPYILITG